VFRESKLVMIGRRLKDKLKDETIAFSRRQLRWCSFVVRLCQTVNRGCSLFSKQYNLMHCVLLTANGF